LIEAAVTDGDRGTVFNDDACGAAVQSARGECYMRRVAAGGEAVVGTDYAAAAQRHGCAMHSVQCGGPECAVPEGS